MLLLHGWPGSPLQFFDLFPIITKIRQSVPFAVEIIVPFLPGFGMSESPQKAGFDVIQMGVVLHNFMKRIFVKEYFIHGSDYGAFIGSAMATVFPESVLGFHTNFCQVNTKRAWLKSFAASLWPSLVIDSHIEWFYPKNFLTESGFLHLQVTKPDTLGAVLAKNPIGQLAFVLEHFSPPLEQTNLLDRLLDMVMLHYSSNSAGGAQRIFKESFSTVLLLDSVKTDVPTACARFSSRAQHNQPDWILKDKYANLIQSTFHEKGGSLPSLTVPDVLAYDILDFIERVDKKIQK